MNHVEAFSGICHLFFPYTTLPFHWMTGPLTFATFFFLPGSLFTSMLPPRHSRILPGELLFASEELLSPFPPPSPCPLVCPQKPFSVFFSSKTRDFSTTFPPPPPFFPKGGGGGGFPQKKVPVQEHFFLFFPSVFFLSPASWPPKKRDFITWEHEFTWKFCLSALRRSSGCSLGPLSTIRCSLFSEFAAFFLSFSSLEVPLFSVI